MQQWAAPFFPPVCLLFVWGFFSTLRMMIFQAGLCFLTYSSGVCRGLPASVAEKATKNHAQERMGMSSLYWILEKGPRFTLDFA